MGVYHCNTLLKRNSFQVFPQGASSPFKLYPQRLLPLVLARKDLRFLGTTTCPAPRALPSHLPGRRVPRAAPRGAWAPPARPDSAPAPPAPAGTSRALRRDPGPGSILGTPREGEPQPRCSRVRTARAGHGLSPAGTTHTHGTHTRNIRLAPVRCYRRGAKSHPAGSGLRSPRRDQHREPAARAQPSDNRAPHRCG